MNKKEFKELKKRCSRLKKICFRLKMYSIKEGFKRAFNVVATYRAIKRGLLNRRLNKLKLEAKKIEKDFNNKVITQAIYKYLDRRNLLAQRKITRALRFI